ncbi:MAG: cell division protein FtsH, partial [Lactobacillus iners]|nr:cell division protein FtsH [Lactobacillus iners]
AGPAKKDADISEAQRKRVAYHEAGHAIVGLVLSDSRTVRKVTIVPRGRMGGYNIMLPKEDQAISTKKQLMEQVAGLMGGRAGEEIVVGDQSTGASNDFEQATAIARGMVTQYGMTEVGMSQLESANTQDQMVKPYSESTAEKIDLAIKNILDEGHKVATDIINTHRDTHRLIAEALLKYETLNEKQILSLFKTGKMPEENDYPSEKDALNYEETKEALKRKEDKFLESDSEDQKGPDDAEDSEDPKTND